MKFNGLAFSVVAIGLSVLGWTRSAHAAACTNDTDCPGTTCGSEICTWTTTPHSCVAAGQGTPGGEGWCTDSSDCKCGVQGATCNLTYCTFTTPPDAGSASSGASATSGASSASGAASPSGTSSTSGSASGASTSPSTSSGGGCSMAEPQGASAPWGLGAFALGACFALSRRRRS